jgi:hypothetical protein
MEPSPPPRWMDPPRCRNGRQVYLMVQCMEAWLLADRTTLVTFYGDGFHASSLPGQQDVELIPKSQVIEALERASRHTQKGEYHKTKHGFVLLALIEPERVRGASAHASLLFEYLGSQSDVI